MKKRNLESVSKRLNRSKTGIESFKKDLIKTENQEMEAKAFVPDQSMMISKDEKEVAETLYGLAGMFAETDSIDKKTCHDKETSKVESSLAVEAESFKPVVSVLSSAQTKQIGEIMPLEQSSNFIDRLKQNNSMDAPVSILIPSSESYFLGLDSLYR